MTQHAPYTFTLRLTVRGSRTIMPEQSLEKEIALLT